MKSAPPQADGNDRFPATRWSLVATATQVQDNDAAEKALGELCEIYWYPIYCYLRNHGNSPSDAEDLTQDFFAELIRRDSLATATAERGKLRSFLLTAVKNFAVNEHRKRNAAKRGGGERHVSIDTAAAEAHFALEPSDAETPEILFERAWARILLERVRAELAASYQRAGKQALAAALAPYVGFDEEEPPYRELADQMAMSASSLRVAVFRMRQKFRALLEREIGDTLADPAETEAEINHLMTVFATP